MKKLLPTLSTALLFVSLFLNSTSTAQCPAGIAGIKSIGPTGDYTSLTEAITIATLNGVQGVLIFELQPAYTSVTETFPISIPQINCVNNSNTITIRPQAGAANLSITSAHTTTTIDLNGADYITFDGRPGGTGTVKQLTIENTSTVGSAFRFINDATNNTLQYLTAKGQGTDFDKGVISFSTAGTGNGNDNNLISYCNIQDAGATPVNGIASSGTAGKANSGNEVSNCNISNFFSPTGASAGIYLYLNNSTWNINHNNFFQTASRTTTNDFNFVTNHGIYISNGSGYQVTNNTFGYANEAHTGTTTISGNSSGIIGFVLGIEDGPATTVQGNTVGGISLTTDRGSFTAATSPFSGILASGGNVTISGNTIGSANSNSSIVINANNTWPGYGILLSGLAFSTVNLGTALISNNTIGGIDLLRVGSGDGLGFTGIANAASVSSLTITGNTIGGNTTNSIMLGAGNASELIGISNSVGSAVISNNTLQNFSSAGANGSITGIRQTATTGVCNISANTLHTFTNTAVTGNPQITGIYSAGTDAPGSFVERNLIAGFAAQSTGTAIITGIQGFGNFGAEVTATYQNNMIQLGIDANGNSITNNHVFNGISETGGSNNIYNNSVYIGGSGVVTGANRTAAFNSDVFNLPRNIINNIFVNNRSNGAGTGLHAAIEVEGPGINPQGLVSDYNIFYAGGAGGIVGFMGVQPQTTLKLWQLATGQDIHSGVADPAFINATGNSSTVDLHLAPTNPAEGQGLNIATVTDDFDGQPRTNPADIGADGGAFAFIDLFSPAMYFVPLGNAPVSPAPVLNVRIIEKGTGVQNTHPLAPKIYYRRNSPNPTAWQSQAGIFVSGNGNDGFFNFQPAFGGVTLFAGDAIDYYLIAQDQAGTPNIAISADASHSDVNTQITPPTAPQTFTIKTGLPLTLNAGVGQDYASLTGNGGVFEAINNNALTGNTTIRIHTDLSETGTHALLSIGQNNHSISIVPNDPSVKNITNQGNLSLAMIRFLDAVYRVDIDGSKPGDSIPTFLNFINNHSTPANGFPAISIGSCYDMYFKNIRVATNAANDPNIVISGGGNIKIENSHLTGTPGDGIRIEDGRSFEHSLLYALTGIDLSDNQISNFTGSGIDVQGVNNTVIQNNHIYNDAPGPSGVFAPKEGIYIRSGTGHTITGNYIGGSQPRLGGTPWVHPASGAFTGIKVSGNQGVPIIVNGNHVGNITVTGPGSTFTGIEVTSGNVVAGTNNANEGNIIGSLINANSIQNAGNATTIGMSFNGSANVDATNNIIANVTGTGTGTGANVVGVSHTSSGTLLLEGNSIDALTSHSSNNTSVLSALVGIYVSNSITTKTFRIKKNRIKRLRCNSTTASTRAQGIVSGQFSSNGFITGNSIADIENLSIGANIYGIHLSAGNWDVYNNQVSLTNGSNNSPAIIRGIFDNNSSGRSGTFYYNSIYIGGAATSGAAKSHAYFRGGLATTRLRNNLFYNGRTGGTGNHSAIGNTASPLTTGWNNTASNYNLFVAPDLTKVGEWGNNAFRTLTQWRSISGGDASSLLATPTDLVPGSFFINHTDGNLNINPAYTGAWYVNGNGVPLPGDWEDFSSTGTIRSNAITAGSTDIGSDEFMPTVLPPFTTITGTHTNGGTETFSFAGRDLGSITWGNSGSLPNIDSIRYFSGTWPNDVSNGGATPLSNYFDAYWLIDFTGGSGYNYQLNLNYDDAVAGTVTESIARLARKTPGVNGTWQVNKASVVNPVSNTLSFGGLTNGGEFTATNQTSADLCPGGSSLLTSSITGSNYQWQVNEGNGYANITDNANYSGTNTATLQLINIPSSWYGYRYRALADGAFSNELLLQFTNVWLGTINTAWENPGNWSCGTVPDINTDVIINSGTVFLNTNTGTRSVKMREGATLTIKDGFVLTVVK